MKKTKQVIVRLTEDDRYWLGVLADYEKMTMSQYIRSIIRKETTPEAIQEKIKSSKGNLRELKQGIMNDIKKREKEIEEDRKVLGVRT